MIRLPYTTCFGAILDGEIADALKYGMSIERLHDELEARRAEVAKAIEAKARILATIKQHEMRRHA